MIYPKIDGGDKCTTLYHQARELHTLSEYIVRYVNYILVKLLLINQSSNIC